MPETCPEHSSLDKGSDFEDETSNLKFVDGRMQIYPKVIQETDENIRRINAEKKLHVPAGTAEPIPSTEKVASKLAPILEIIAEAYKQK